MASPVFGTFMYINKFNSPNKSVGVSMIPSLADKGNEVERDLPNQF